MPIVCAQVKNELSVEFNVNRFNYNMKSLNYYTNLAYILSPQWYGTDCKKIENGFDYNLYVKYQIHDFIGIGMFANYQFSSIRRPMRYVYTDQEYPFDSDPIVFDGTNYVEVNAISFGFSSSLYLNQLFHLDESSSKFLKNVQCSITLIGGLGLSNMIDRFKIYKWSSEVMTHYKSTDFQGKTELSIGYRFGKTIFPDAGFKVGYQFFKTSDLKNYTGYNIYPDNDGKRAVHLDFSGLYYGIYLKIGK